MTVKISDGVNKLDETGVRAGWGWAASANN